jgi:hypothetical protein
MPIRRLCTRTLPLVVLVFALTAAARAQSTPQAAVATFMDGFNSGDMARSAAMNSAKGTSIIDEFPPYSWSGPKAFDEWGTGFDANSKAQGVTDAKVTLEAPIVQNITADHAYLIYPSLYVYKQRGVVMREAGRVAIVLRKEGADWKIAAWTWTGTMPKRGK